MFPVSPFVPALFGFIPHLPVWKTFFLLKTESPIEVKKTTSCLSSVADPPSTPILFSFLLHEVVQHNFGHSWCLSSAPPGSASPSCFSYRCETLLKMSPESLISRSFGSPALL